MWSPFLQKKVLPNCLKHDLSSKQIEQMCSYVQMDKSLEPEHWAMRATLPYSCPPCHFPEPCCWFWPLVLRFLVLSPCLSLNVLTPCPSCSSWLLSLTPVFPLLSRNPVLLYWFWTFVLLSLTQKFLYWQAVLPVNLPDPRSPWCCPDPLFSYSCPNTMLSITFPDPLSWPHAPLLLVLSPSHTVLCPQPLSALFLSISVFF